MGRSTVVAFIVVVRQDLPVVVAVHLPDVVKVVVVEVELLHAILSIYAGEVVFPGDFGSGLAVQVDPDEAVGVDVKVDGEQAVIVFVEAVEFLVAGCLGEPAVQAVYPAVIFASEDLC